MWLKTRYVVSSTDKSLCFLTGSTWPNTAVGNWPCSLTWAQQTFMRSSLARSERTQQTVVPPAHRNQQVLANTSCRCQHIRCVSSSSSTIGTSGHMRWVLLSVPLDSFSGIYAGEAAAHWSVLSFFVVSQHSSAWGLPGVRQEGAVCSCFPRALLTVLCPSAAMSNSTLYMWEAQILIKAKIPLAAVPAWSVPYRSLSCVVD